MAGAPRRPLLGQLVRCFARDRGCIRVGHVVVPKVSFDQKPLGSGGSVLLPPRAGPAALTGGSAVAHVPRAASRACSSHAPQLRLHLPEPACHPFLWPPLQPLAACPPASPWDGHAPAALGALGRSPWLVASDGLLGGTATSCALGLLVWWCFCPSRPAWFHCVVYLCPPPPNNRIISCTFMTK